MERFDEAAVRALLGRLRLLEHDSPIRLEPLAGGVSSEILRVDLPARSLCIKRALPRLRVAADWRVPVARSAHEAQWLHTAHRLRPENVPAPLGYDALTGTLVLPWLAPDQYPVWKGMLREGRVAPAFADALADLLADIHGGTAADPAIAAAFDTGPLFHALRLDPYLLAVAARHPALAPRLRALTAATALQRIALVHGDVSPKNILVGPGGPVLIDAECAWYGDPAFDLAFCLNHLLLKCLWVLGSRAALLESAGRLAGRYLARVAWEPREALAGRVAALLPALMLARVDGKSPVEYLTEAADQDCVRTFASRWLLEPADSPADLIRAWGDALASCPVPAPPPTESAVTRTTPPPVATRIVTVLGRRVWDSRGRPTVEAEVRLQGGARGRAIAPAGASTGSGEAVDLRDGGPAFGGHDVTRALAGLRDTIAPALLGMDATDQAAIDHRLVELDGTPDRSRLGGNALVATSMAVAHAAAAAAELPLWAWLRGGRVGASLPLPEIQVFGGGAHAGGRLDVQDFMVVAVGAPDWPTALDWTAEVYRQAGLALASEGRLQGVADEGGFWPAFDDNEQALAALVRAIEAAGLRPGEDMAIALDIAASNFGRGGRYRLARPTAGGAPREVRSGELAGMLLGWLGRWPIVSIEDPLAEDDTAGLAAFTAAAPAGVQVVLDDAVVTSAARIAAHVAAGAGNTALIKPNQAGTLTEARAALDAARAAGWQSIVSARSGETEDVTIVHLAVGWGVAQLKVGSFARSERMAKWNEGLRIGEALAGGFALPPRTAFGWR